MINRLIRRVVSNFWWKIISVFLAFFLWIFVTSSINPLTTVTYTVPLEINNMSVLSQQEMAILNIDEVEGMPVKIKVRATQQDIVRLEESSENIKASITLMPVEDIENNTIDTPYTYSINAILPYKFSKDSYEIVSISPSSVDLFIDKYKTQDYDVQVNVEGNAAEGYIAMTPVVTPSTVSITGVKSVMDTIDKVEVNIVLNDNTIDMKKNVDIIVTDVSGNDITDKVILSNKYVDVLVPIKSIKKIDIIEPATIGTTAEGYQVASISYEPSSIEVTGNSSDLDNLNKIVLPLIDLNYASESFIEIINIDDILSSYKAEPLYPYSGNVTVYVDIQPVITQHIYVPISNVKNIGTNEKVLYEDEYVDITVQGTQTNIDKINPNDITGTINVSNLKSGLYSQDVKINIPYDNIKIVNVKPINIIIP